jgi:hypothetical protein
MDGPDLPVVYRQGRAVVLDAYGLPCTAADLARVLTGLEAQAAAAPDELRRFYAAPIAWRRRLLAALETLEARHAA